MSWFDPSIRSDLIELWVMSYYNIVLWSMASLIIFAMIRHTIWNKFQDYNCALAWLYYYVLAVGWIILVLLDPKSPNRSIWVLTAICLSVLAFCRNRHWVLEGEQDRSDPPLPPIGQGPIGV